MEKLKVKIYYLFCGLFAVPSFFFTWIVGIWIIISFMTTGLDFIVILGFLATIYWITYILSIIWSLVFLNKGFWYRQFRLLPLYHLSLFFALWIYGWFFT